MQDIIRSWTQFLAAGNGGFGAVLTVLGFCYVFAGWRFGRAAHVVNYAAVGIAAGIQIGQSGAEDFIYAGVMAAVLVAICIASGKYAGALFAGALGVVVAWWWLGPMDVPAVTMCIALALSFGAFGAVGATNDRIASIVVTSLVGAIFMVSGMIGMASESRAVANQLRSMASFSIFYPLLLTVVAVSGIMLQLAAAKRQDVGSVG